jgi:hypothetical protein
VANLLNNEYFSDAQIKEALRVQCSNLAPDGRLLLISEDQDVEKFSVFRKTPAGMQLERGHMRVRKGVTPCCASLSVEGLMRVGLKFLIAAAFSALRACKVAADKNGLLDAVRGDVPSSIRPYPYGNFVLAAVATIKRKGDLILNPL